MEASLLTEEDTQHGRYLTFSLSGESFGLEISYVKEIVGMQPITPVPQVPVYVKGIINLRGMVIPVIDVRLKFCKPEAAYDDRTCIIVVETQEASVGLIVDKVSDVMTIDDGSIVPPPSIGMGAQNDYIKAIGKVGNDVKLILDCKKIIGTNLIPNTEQ
jgi:purine-binding chemotaxis protein CheW